MKDYTHKLYKTVNKIRFRFSPPYWTGLYEGWIIRVLQTNTAYTWTAQVNADITDPARHILIRDNTDGYYKMPNAAKAAMRSLKALEAAKEVSA